jgi:hypothetical protein
MFAIISKEIVNSTKSKFVLRKWEEVIWVLKYEDDLCKFTIEINRNICLIHSPNNLRLIKGQGRTIF